MSKPLQKGDRVQLTEEGKQFLLRMRDAYWEKLGVMPLRLPVVRIKGIK